MPGPFDKKDDVILSTRRLVAAIKHPEMSIGGEDLLTKIKAYNDSLRSFYRVRAASWMLTLNAVTGVEEAADATSPESAQNQYELVLNSMATAEEKIQAGNVADLEFIRSLTNSWMLCGVLETATNQLEKFWRSVAPAGKPDGTLPTPGEPAYVARLEKKLDEVLSRLG